jgi:D-alanyl-D-alanine endopeptidase (penicillin-binding protein 7)
MRPPALLVLLLMALALPLCLRAAPAGDDDPWRRLNPARLHLRSRAALVTDQAGRDLYCKNEDIPQPIASITKLMTALVVLDSQVPLDRLVTISKADRDTLRLTGSRLEPGNATLRRRELLKIALVASENRAAAALGRTTFPGGTPAFVQAMNRTAKALSMEDSRFVDPTGLSERNLASARDLVKLLKAARRRPLIREATTTRRMEVRPYRRRGRLHYVNTNRLLNSDDWDIRLSKTGYINEAGRCLVMEATLYGHTLHIVLLNSFGKLTPFGDSNRLRKWIGVGLESG